MRDEPLTLWGDGSTIRDYLFVEDLMSLCAAALTTALDAGAHAFNAASGKSISLNALIDRIDAITGRPIRRVYEPTRRVDVHSITADTTAARSTFTWTPAVTLDEGLHRTWHWFSTRA